MSRRKKDPLRPLTDDEGAALAQLSRSQAAPAAQVARATMLLAVARGDDYQQAARAAGRRSGDAVSHLVARFNAEGLAALVAPPRRRAHARLRPGGAGADPARGPAAPDPGGRRHGDLVADAPCGRRCGPAPDGLPRGLDLHPLAGPPRGRLQPPADPHLVPHRHGPAPPQGRRGGRHRPGRRVKKKLIEDAYRLGRGDGPVGLVHRPGRAVPDGAATRPVLAARGRAGPPAARVPPRRHGQGPDAVPPGRRAGPRRGRDEPAPTRCCTPGCKRELAAVLAGLPGAADAGGGGRRGGPRRLGAVAGRA